MQNCNFSCRGAVFSDSVEEIAKYIHLTDPYIYPVICQSPIDEDWVRLIGSCMKVEGNVFNVKHLSVVLSDERIVGIACVIPCGRALTFTDGINDISKAFLKKLEPVTDGYFTPLISESLSYSGYNITNVCIDADFRNRGLGSLILSHCIDKYGTQPIHLDVIASNGSAIRLYKRHGFEITDEYYGFSGCDEKLLCYHMVRMP